MLHVRVDDHIKAAAADTLAEMGLSVSDAVRVFLTRVVAEQQIPFAIKVPNAKTRAAMKEVQTMIDRKAPGFKSATALVADLETRSKKK
jgi:DNA-damage-inducible protein J